MINEIVLYLIGFSIFVILQSLFINGIHECFRGQKLVDGVSGKVDYQGMIFYEIAPKFFEKYKHKKWSYPLWVCVKCMSSVWGILTFMPLAIWLFGFRWIEIPVQIADSFILVYLNWFFYKRV